MAERGWRYEVWSGTSEVLLTNVRFIAQGRRPALVHAPAVAPLARRIGLAERWDKDLRWPTGTCV